MDLEPPSHCPTAPGGRQDKGPKEHSREASPEDSTEDSVEDSAEDSPEDSAEEIVREASNISCLYFRRYGQRCQASWAHFPCTIPRALAAHHPESSSRAPSREVFPRTIPRALPAHHPESSSQTPAREIARNTIGRPKLPKRREDDTCTTLCSFRKAWALKATSTATSRQSHWPQYRSKHFI